MRQTKKEAFHETDRCSTPPFPCPQSRPVWIAAPENRENQYVMFMQRFSCREAGAVRLLVACDSRASIWLNGVFQGLCLYDGTDTASWYETFDLSQAVRPGANELWCEVFYQGVSSNNYTAGSAHLIFAVEQLLPDGSWAVLTASGADTLCREDRRYRQGPVETNQTGFVWHFDAAAAQEPYRPAQVLALEGRGYLPRSIERQRLLPRHAAAICAHGYLMQSPAETFETAFLSARQLTQQVDTSKTYYQVWDCGEECTGLIELEVETQGSCRIEIGWGEHLSDLRVRSCIASRCFQSSWSCGSGRHFFRHDFQRVGLRYLEVHIFPQENGPAVCNYVGVRPLMYPVEERGSFRCSDALHEKIYQTAVRTLKLCMHEHYEDCPWPEQALYAMDSLNQMLCGYYCFGEYRFAAASLSLLASGMQQDGFLELHTPGKDRVTIPYFTFMWVVAVREYLLFSGDTDFAGKLWPTIQFAVEQRRKELEGALLPTPTGTEYWNFYEWTDLLSGEPIYRQKPLAQRIDAPYQMFFLLMLQAAAEIAGHLGKQEYALQLEALQEAVRSACHTRFWNEEDSCYRTYAPFQEGQYRAEKQPCAELVQALAVLTGVAGPEERARLLPQLAQGNEGWTPCTLSMIRFKYEALLTQQAQYLPLVFADIANIWGHMLFSGATSFWETADGAAAFDGAGSLCHGWSAMPVYFYYAYILGIRPQQPGFRNQPMHVRQVQTCLGKCKGQVPTPKGIIHVES